MIFAGWVCANALDENSPRCGFWNGEEKARRETCRACGGPRTAAEGMSREDLFSLCAMMIAERNQATEMLTRTQERLARYIEVARCAKAWLAAPNEEYDPATAMAIKRLEEGAGSAALLTPPTSC